MNFSFSRFSTVVALLLLSACTTTPRQSHQAPIGEERWACCCDRALPCEGDCHALYPDDLDDFGPPPGDRRIVRCDRWQTMDQFAHRCGE